ncbi:hypothetical protein F0Q45_09275 [Mycobacterium simiae]|uniref:Uncharacterized protein n=1 Tax=Mycobacterium simiae TaxID=1784 RepID=A0A5B1BT84_MYCSI|nr:hypothetical protein [Mycobacterium simiae]KAA1250494.1 hypothetical protein F0Q45_09275 [Mycobacterium simiae]
MSYALGVDTKLTLLAAGLIFLLALLLGVFVELSAWPAWVNTTAAMAVVFFFVAAIGSYILHGARRDTENQFDPPAPGTELGMVLLILGEIGGFSVVFAGFIVGQLS